MSLLPKAPKTPHRQMAESLQAALKAARKGDPRQEHLTTWEKDFRRCCSAYGEAEAREVLAWYLRHLGDDYVPRAYSAVGFVSKFEQLRRAMQAADLPEGEVWDRWKALAARMQNERRFPPEIAARLAQVAHRTDECRCKLGAALESWRREAPKHERGQLFSSHVLTMHMPLLTENWLILLSRKFGFLDHYTGNTGLLHLHAESEVFRGSFWRAWSLDWSGDAKAFDGLFDLVREGMR